MKKDNLIQKKSFDFALRIIKLSKFLSGKNERIIANQILRSWTSIGANIEEAIGAQSDRDFFAKITISYKEARETLYWLRLLKESKILDEKLALSLIVDSEEIIKIIGKIQKSLKLKNTSDKV